VEKVTVQDMRTHAKYYFGLFGPERATGDAGQQRDTTVRGPTEFCAGVPSAVTVRAVPGAVKRPQRFHMKIHFVWGVCMGALGA
jgi:hypothetical protein